MFNSFLIISCLFYFSFASPFEKFDEIPEDASQNTQLKLDENGQCIYVKSEEGTYSFQSSGTQQICGLYIIAEPSKKVQFEFESFDISCVKGGLMSVIDGWELNGQFFPSLDERKSQDKAYLEFCSKNQPRKPIMTSQNVGLIEFRIPLKQEGFKVTVKFIDNPKPCNVVLQEPQGTYTLRNYNRKTNCSVSVIFPLTIQILAASIGVQSKWPIQNFDIETGLVTKCKKRGIYDFVEILGGDGLDPSKMQQAADYCGLSSLQNNRAVTVGCGNTAVKLVSTGRYENSVTFSFDLPTDFSRLDLICPSFFASIF